MTTKRIQVKETKEYWGNFVGSFEDIISSLQKCKDIGWEGLEFRYDINYGNEYYLYKHREETDEEYDKRVKLLEKEKERKLEKLKKDLASLSAADKKLLGL
jgi:Asp-tRNA(Asn)/Glu-tRNA(Gln) amidotransferase C subunit